VRGPLDLKIKKRFKKKKIRLPDDAPFKFSLTGTGRGGGPLALKIKKKEIKIKKNCAWQRTHRLNFLRRRQIGAGGRWRSN
jgi:hypothetical protein